MSTHTVVPAASADIPAHQPEHFGKLCTALAAVCLVLALVMPVMVPLYWAWAPTDSLLALANLGIGDIRSPLHGGQRAIGALVSAVPVLLMSWTLWRARECLADLAQGQAFTAHAARCMRRLAVLIACTALAAFAAVPLLSVSLTWENAVGARAVVVGGGVAHALVLLCAMVLWLMSGVLRQGQLLAEENAAFL